MSKTNRRAKARGARARVMGTAVLVTALTASGAWGFGPPKDECGFDPDCTLPGPRRSGDGSEGGSDYTHGACLVDPSSGEGGDPGEGSTCVTCPLDGDPDWGALEPHFRTAFGSELFVVVGETVSRAEVASDPALLTGIAQEPRDGPLGMCEYRLRIGVRGYELDPALPEISPGAAPRVAHIAGADESDALPHWGEWDDTFEGVSAATFDFEANPDDPRGAAIQFAGAPVPATPWSTVGPPGELHRIFVGQWPSLGGGFVEGADFGAGAQVVAVNWLSANFCWHEIPQYVDKVPLYLALYDSAGHLIEGTPKPLSGFYPGVPDNSLDSVPAPFVLFAELDPSFGDPGSDTDGDGFLDRVEIEQGFDPADPASPAPTVAGVLDLSPGDVEIPSETDCTCKSFGRKDEVPTRKEPCIAPTDEWVLPSVTVEGPDDLEVMQITLRTFEVMRSSRAYVRARIYDAETDELIAWAETRVGNGLDQNVSMPISARLEAGRTYRIGFYLRDPAYADEQRLLGDGEAWMLEKAKSELASFRDETGALRVHGSPDLSAPVPLMSLGVRWVASGRGGSRCGLGFEAALLVPVLTAWGRRRGRSAAAGPR